MSQCEFHILRMAQRATLPYLTLVQAHCQNKFVIDTTQLRTLNNLHETT
jgi:hypothetical protein